MSKTRRVTKSSTKGNHAMNDWITSLAKQASISGETNPTLPKQERLQQRAAKKARRQQRQEDRKRPIESNDKAPTKILPQKRATDHNSSKRRLKRLAELWIALRKEHQTDQRQRVYAPDNTSDRIKRKHALNEENIQPRTCDYSGIGLARKSLFLPFQDPSHIRKLEEEFLEHIPGFFGKQRTKAMKRQLDGNMLWRKLADQKQKGGDVLPKKFAHLSPDERVQAMIDAGMI